MAQIVTAPIYGINGYDQGNVQGFLKGFPATDILIEDISTDPQTFSTVSCISKITLLPTGLTLPKRAVYYTPTAIATLVNDANA